MMPRAIGTIILIFTSWPGWSSVTNDFRVCATKALNGDYGKLRAWQNEGYSKGLVKSIKHIKVAQTIYYPSEGFPRGATCSSGMGCSERVAAANKLKQGSFLWVLLQEGGQLRQVLDKGAPWNDRRWKAHCLRRYGIEVAAWVDLWVPYVGWKGQRNDIVPRDVVLIPR